MDHAKEAKTLLVHYLGLAIGEPLTSDQVAEIETIVDHVIDAAVVETARRRLRLRADLFGR